MKTRFQVTRFYSLLCGAALGSILSIFGSAPLSAQSATGTSPYDRALEQWVRLPAALPVPATPQAAPAAKQGENAAGSISPVNGVRGTVWRPIGPSPFQQNA